VPLTKALARFRVWQSGMMIGKGYRVGQHISAGAEGDVYCAISVGPVHEVALKRIRVTNAQIQRHVQQEVEAVFKARACYAEEVGDPAALGHPHIVGYVDWFAGSSGLDREIYIAMERCDFSLNDMIFTVATYRSTYERRYADLKKSTAASGGAKKTTLPASDPALYRFTEREVVKVMHQMLLAIAFLNRHGIFHRDIKPENILWADGRRLGGRKEGSYRLTDFGTAACLAEGESKRTDDCGTLWTMAPEILGRRAHGCSCDVWSLGVTLFEMASLEKLFQSKELMVYRSTEEASVEGSFWPSMCAQAPGLGPPSLGSILPVALGAAARPNPSSPASSGSSLPSSPKAAGSQAGAAARKSKTTLLPTAVASAAALAKPGGARGSNAEGSTLRRSASLPQVVAGAKQQSSSLPSSPTASKSGAASRKRRGLDLQQPLQPIELADLGGRDEGGGGQPPTLELPASPASSAATRAAEALLARKHAFLRKRCTFRWCYSEVLRTAICEELLEEDPLLRAAAAGILVSPKVEGFLTSYGWDAEEPLHTVTAPAVAKDVAETDAAESPTRASTDSDGSTEKAGKDVGLASEWLKHVTGETFLLAMKAEAEKLKREQEEEAEDG